jgi:uncharacterized membrane protein
MAANILRFIVLALLALLVGTMFGIWVGFDPASLSASGYVEQQQNAIRSLNTLLPAMGAICIVLTFVLAYLAPRGRDLLIAAALLMLVTAAVTRFGNQPINAVVMTWSVRAPAANWAQLRDQWWQWHIVRSVTGIGAFLLLVIEALASRRVPR